MVQTTETLGHSTGPERISKSDAKRLQAEFMAKVNGATSMQRRRFRHEATVGEFVEQIYFTRRQDPTVKTVRENTFKAERQRLNAYVLPVLGSVTFEALTQENLGDVLRAARERDLGAEMLRKIRADVIRVCRAAKGHGCLDRDIWEGLGRVTPKVSPEKKLVLAIEDYVKIWDALEPRDRLAFDLVMFQGLRESEVFGLQCGDLVEHGLEIRRSFFRHRIEFPKTEDSKRTIGFTGPLRSAFEAHIKGLPANAATDWVFPSTAIVTPEDPGNAMKNRIKPVLDSLGYRWVNFAILRRSCSTRNDRAARDLKLTAFQQGHDPATHLQNYVQYDPKALAEGPEQDYHEFEECRSKGVK